MKKKMVGILVITLMIATGILPVAGTSFEQVELKKEKCSIQPITSFQIITDKTGEDNSNLVANAEVYTNKFFYRKYEPIDITFFNKGPGSVSFGGPPFYRINRFSIIGFQWKHVYPDWVGMVLYTVQEGGSMSDTWDQKTTNGDQVSFGLYKLNVPYSSSMSYSQQNATNHFFILP